MKIKEWISFVWALLGFYLAVFCFSGVAFLVSKLTQSLLGIPLMLALYAVIGIICAALFYASNQIRR